MWPGDVSCDDGQGRPAEQACKQAGTINPNFAVRCDPTLLVCVVAKRPPSLKCARGKGGHKAGALQRLPPLRLLEPHQQQALDFLEVFDVIGNHWPPVGEPLGCDQAVHGTLWTLLQLQDAAEGIAALAMK
jgi:hypothetical protein